MGRRIRVMLFVYLTLLAGMFWGPLGPLRDLILPVALTALTSYHALSAAARTRKLDQGIVDRLIHCVRVPAVPLLLGLPLAYPLGECLLVTLLLLPYYAALGLTLAAWTEQRAGAVAIAGFSAGYLLAQTWPWLYLVNPPSFVGPFLLQMAHVGGCGTGRLRTLQLFLSTPVALLPVAGWLLLLARIAFRRAATRSAAHARTPRGPDRTTPAPPAAHPRS